MPKAKPKAAPQKASLSAKKQEKKPSAQESAQTNNKRTRSTKIEVEPVTKKIKKNDNTSKTVKKTVEPPKKVVSKKEAKLQEKNEKKNNKKIVIDDTKQTKKEPIKNDSSTNNKKNKKSAVDNAIVPAPKVEAVKEETKNVVAVKKFGAVVDPNCPIKEKVHVFSDASKTYDHTLNQSNLDHNNNKFYIIQVLQSDVSPNEFYLWTRWGRVGVPGQNALSGPLSKDRILADFDKKFEDKTVKGDYVKIEISYDDDEEKKEEAVVPKKGKKMAVSLTVDIKRARSLIDGRLQSLVSLIFDLKMMNTQMKEIGYDAKKMPLGKIAKSTIQNGYEVLNKLMNAFQKKEDKSTFQTLSSQFYSLIPHDFGFQKMSNFILDTEEKVKAKLDMLQALSDIQIATKLLSEEVSPDENLIDSNYRKLNCKLKPIDRSGKDYTLIEKFIQNTGGSWKIKLNDIFEVERPNEAERFVDYGNKMLLWHGSRLTNFVGILSQGLRIAPPEAPASGYRFGKGVYFADMIDKSAQYCRASGGQESLALLCEVSCGVFNEKTGSDYNASNLPKGKHSTLGLGQGPDKKTWVKWNNDVSVPVGDKNSKNVGWNHNEYIVYDVKQVQMRFLVRMNID